MAYLLMFSRNILTHLNRGLLINAEEWTVTICIILVNIYYQKQIIFQESDYIRN